MKVESPLERFAASSRDHLAPPSQHIDGAQAKVMKDALHVIHVLLGKDYLERELDTSRSGGYLMLDGPDDQDDDEVAGLERAERVLTLAWELHGAQLIPGFDDLLPELRKRSMYEAVAEMRAVNQMCNHSDELKFIDPNAGGPTYDAEMVFNGVRVAAEVKAKIAKPVETYRPDLVTRTLSKARKQLPPAGPSLVYLQLVSPWTDDVDVMRSVDRAIRHWLTNTARVNGVVVLTERRFARPEGGYTLTTGAAFIPNLTPRTPVEGIND